MSNKNRYSRTLPVDTGASLRRLTPDGRASEVAAITSKLVSDVTNQRFGQGYVSAPTARGEKQLQMPDMGMLQRISQLTANDVNDAQTIFQLLPETQLAMQILVSSILAPKDLVNTSVNYSLDSNRFNSELSGAMLNVVSDHFDKIYKISDLLEPSLEDALFKTGSYPLMILPESSIDRAINGIGRVSLESLRDDFDAESNLRTVGFLNNPRSDNSSPFKINFGLESLPGSESYKSALPSHEGIDPLIDVIDNVNILKMQQLQERITRDRTLHLLNRRGMTGVRSASVNISQESISASMEARHNPYNPGVTFGVDSRRGALAGDYRPVEIIQQATELNRPTVGHPAVYKLPSESVIPVHQPSNPAKHLCYFVMLDQMGNPINSVDQRDYYRELSSTLNPNSSMGSQLLQQVRRNMEGMPLDRQAEIDEMSRIYGQYIEKQLTERLQDTYGKNVEITAPEEVYRVMLGRAMAKRRTQILLVPAEMMTYIAFDYNKYGIGQSLIQQSKVLGSIRVLALFAETMGSIKNAINRTNVDIQLDPEDPNPTHTVEFLMGEYAKTRQGSFPLGATNPTDIISYLQNASVDVTVQGNTRFPEVKFNVSERQSNRIKPDEGMTKDLRDRWLMSLGLSPDMLDAGAGADFATSVLANNLLLAKRVLNYQNTLEGFLKDFVVKYVLADGYLMDELRDLIKQYGSKLTREQDKANELSKKVAEQKQTLRDAEKKTGMESINQHLENLEDMGHDAVIMEFLQCIKISLPKPDMATVKTQMDAFNDEQTAVDTALKVILDPSFLMANGLGSLADLVDPTREAVKAMYMRKWLRDNNVLPNVMAMLNPEDDDRIDVTKEITEHTESMADSLLKVMYGFAKIRHANDPAVDKLATLIEGGDGGSGWGGGDNTFAAPAASGADMSGDMPEFGDETVAEEIPLDETGTDETTEGGETTAPDDVTL